MREIFKKWLFKDQIEKSSDVAMVEDEVKFKIKRLESDLEYMRKCANHAIEMQKSGLFTVIGVDHTKYGETMIIYHLSGNDLSFYLGDADTWMSTHDVAVLLEHDSKENKLHIDDIQMNTSIISRGYGSLVMKHLKMIADKNEVVTMVGRLYYDDHEHRNRQVEFYSKNGFKIKGDSIIWKRTEQHDTLDKTLQF